MMHGEEKEAAAPMPARVGVDRGSQGTRIAFLGGPGGEEEQLAIVPTLLSYSRKEAEPVRFSCIGEKALARRDHMRLVHPYRSGLEGRGLILRDFANHLRELHQKRGVPAPWAVVSCSTRSEERRVGKGGGARG